MIRMVVQSHHGTRIRIEGPEILIPLSQAQALGLVINELATNSLKYGAMREAAAAVDITWSMRSIEDGETSLTLDWRETGGPAIDIKPTPGTGAMLIEGLIRSELRGQAELRYPPEGATHTLTITLTSEATSQFSSPGK
jgi:two-component sensor histidine kinase